MKKLCYHLFLIAISVAVIILASCSKSDHPMQPPVNNGGTPPADSKVKVQKSATVESIYEYDNAGRVKKVTTNGVTEYDYTFAGDSLIQKRYFANGAVMETYHIKLNGNGLVENYLNDKYPSIKINYEYNAAKQVVKKSNYQDGILATVTYYFYSNGNLVKDSTAFQGPGAGWYGRSYEYYTDICSTLENENRGQAHWGAGNKNALKQTTYLDKGNTTGTQEYQLPEQDELHRISKTGMTTNNAGVPVVYNYTYY